MLEAVYQVMTLLCELVAPVPIVTNLVLLLVRWLLGRAAHGDRG